MLHSSMLVQRFSYDAFIRFYNEYYQTYRNQFIQKIWKDFSNIPTHYSYISISAYTILYWRRAFQEKQTNLWTIVHIFSYINNCPATLPQRISN